MGALLAFNLHAAVFLAVLYLVYKLALSGEKQPALNRTLIFGIVAVAYLAQPLRQMVNAQLTTATAAAGAVDFGALAVQTVQSVEAAPLWPLIAVGVYAAGMLAVALGSAVQYLRLRRLLHGGCRLKRPGYTLIVIGDDRLAPFSWGRYVVINSRDYADGADLVLAHELAHIRGRHTADMVVMQLVCIMQWFNPAAWLLRSELQTVHEYQADAEVLNRGADIKDYQMLLIKKAVGTRLQSLANSLNHSNLKKRITIMYKSDSKGARRVRTLVLAPALALAFALAGSPLFTAAAGSIAAASTNRSNVTEVKSQPKRAVKVTAGKAVSVTTAASADKGTKKSANSANETMAEFPGGTDAMFEYMYGNLQYPKSAQDEGREGNTVVQFTVNAEGNITNVKVMKSIGDDLDAEAARLISSMPRWTPATVDGKPVAVQYALPVNFKLKKTAKAADAKPQPAIMVNGELYKGDLNSIDPSTIQNIEVIKNRTDYPNGLIMITLKK